MRKRVMALSLLMCLTLCGCEKPKFIREIAASPYVDSYKDMIQQERPTITGNVTLESGDYVVYSNPGGNCVIQGDGHNEVFSEREYIHVDEDIEVQIGEGYLMKLSDAAALNGEIENDGVLLVGFDILPNDKEATDNFVEIVEEIPTLFEQPKSITYQKFDRTTLKDGMVIRLDNAFARTKQIWDAEDAANEWITAWEDTSIDYKRGYTIEKPEEEIPVLEGSQNKKPDDIETYELPIYGEKWYLLEDYDHERIDMWEEEDETLYRAYYHRIWFRASEDYTFTTTAKNMYSMNAPKYGDNGKLIWDKLKKCAYAETDPTKVVTTKKLNDMYIIGYDIPEGFYKIKAGRVKFLGDVPSFQEYRDMVSQVDALPSYTTDAEIPLSEGDVIMCEDLEIQKIRNLLESDRL